METINSYSSLHDFIYVTFPVNERFLAILQDNNRQKKEKDNHTDEIPSDFIGSETLVRLIYKTYTNNFRKNVKLKMFIPRGLLKIPN